MSQQFNVSFCCAWMNTLQKQHNECKVMMINRLNMNLDVQRQTIYNQFILARKWFDFMCPWPIDHCFHFCHSVVDIGMYIDLWPSQDTTSRELQPESRLICLKWFQAECCYTIVHQIWTVSVQCRIRPAEVRHTADKCLDSSILMVLPGGSFWHTSAECWFKLIFITVLYKWPCFSSNMQYLYFIWEKNISDSHFLRKD